MEKTFTILISLHLCVLCFEHPKYRPQVVAHMYIWSDALSRVPKQQCELSIPLPVLVLPHLRVSTALYFLRTMGTCGQQPGHKPAKCKPPQTASKPLWLSAPLFRVLSSRIKLQRREVRSSALLGRAGGVCVSDRVNQTNESAVSQPHPCSHVQDLHFRQTLQSPDSDFQGKSLHVSSTRGTDAVVW